MQAANWQGIAAGIRSGIGGNMDIANMKSEGVKQRYWNKQVFGRYETKKRLVFELSATQYNYDYNQTPRQFEYYMPPTHEILNVYTRHNVLDIGLSAQYDVTCSVLKEKCPLFKNFKNYIGVNMNFLMNNAKHEILNRSLSDGMLTKRNEQSNGSDVYLGLSHTATYSFNKIFIISSASFMIDPWGDIGSRYLDGMPAHSNARLSLTADVGYKF